MSELIHHLAQVNVARMQAPLSHPQMADFVNGLAPINALADASPGFVWRLQTEAGDATSLRVFDDDMLIVNMSVWETIDALRAYVYQSAHVDFIRRRKAWFQKLDTPHFAMWWIPAGHVPTTTEAQQKLEHLAHHGDSPSAFTFRKVYQPS